MRLPNPRLPLLLVALACVLAGLPLWWGAGIVNTHAGGDSPFLLVRTYELVSNLRAGVFPARWMPDAAFGLGYPFFNFYAALPYYLAALLNLIGFDLITAIKLTQSLGLFAAAWGMWRFARSWLSPWGAGLAAVAYTLAPFHLVNLYVRGDSLSEFYAFVWYPLILWSLRRLVHIATSGNSVRNTLRSGAFFGLLFSVAALVLTHNVSALIFAPVIVVYALALSLRAKSALPKVMITLSIAALLALMVSAWFWLPALAESTQVQLGEQTTGFFYFANHFRTSDLVQRGLLFDYAVDPALTVCAMSLVQALLAGLGLVLWRLRSPSTPARAGGWWLALLGLLYGTLMITPLSAWLWGHVPLLALAQFPWRFFSVQSLFVALLIGGVWTNVSMHQRPVAQIGFALVVGVLLFSSLWGIPNERLNVQARDVNPRSIQLYEWYSGNIGTTIRAEYLPKTAQPVPQVGPALMGFEPRAYPIAWRRQMDEREPIRANRVEATPDRQVWQVDVLAAEIDFTLPLLAAPGWVELTNDGERELQAYTGSGWVQLSRPHGQHRIELRYRGTPLQRAGNWIALIGLVTVLVLMLFRRVGLPFRRGSSQRRPFVFVVATLVVIVLLAQLSRIVQAADTPSLQAIDDMARLFPHRGPINLIDPHAQSFQLIGAEVNPTQIQAGQVITLNLNWANAAPPTITVKLELPPPSAFAMTRRVFRHHVSEAVGDAHQITLTVPAEALPGPTLLRLSLSDDAHSHFVVGPTVVATPANVPANTQRLFLFASGFILHGLDFVNTSDQDICFRPVWSRLDAPGNRADAFQMSFRLFDARGQLIAQADGQPQAGLAPTWSWPNGAMVEDSYCGVPIARPFQEGEALTLDLVYYRRAPMQELERIQLHAQWHATPSRVVVFSP